MVDVQHVEGGAYVIRLNERLIEAIGFGSPERIMRGALVEKFREMYPTLFPPVDDEVPF